MELVLDVETTTHNKGNPYDSRNKLVSIHAHNDGESWSAEPTDDLVQGVIEDASLIIMFNAKFDIAWLRKHGIDVSRKPLWDVQLAHFMLRYQTVPFPSLDDVLTYYGLPPKLSVVETEYWDKGIQTDQIPWNILCEYGEADAEKTYQCYLRQVEEFKNDPQLYKVFRLACKDTYVLQEMEWNGLKYNEEKCIEKSKELQQSINKLLSDLGAIYPDVPINFDSNDQLSAFLYGGTIKEERREVIGFYKTGQKIGQPRYKVIEVEYPLPRLFTPLKGSEMAKEGVYSTAEDTLLKLKGKHKWITEHLLSLAKLSKLKQTYYDGLPKINQEMHWEPGILHPTYNQCRVPTGRLSSSKPNGQNLSGNALEIFETRYHE